MIIVISPAKNLDFDSKHDFEVTKPRLLKFTHELISNLKNKSIQDIEKLMSISTSLATLNAQRFHNFKTNPSSEYTQPAIFAFNGDVYQGLQASSFNAQKMEFAQKHLRILSGLYGILRPLDIIQPYRLEMGTQLAFNDYKTLYDYWDMKIMNLLLEDLNTQNDNIIINLASNEYFKSVNRKELSANVIDVEFKDLKNGEYKIISFYAKKARGLMSKYIVDHAINDPENLKGFNYEGYYYDPVASSARKIVFKRDIKK